MPWILLVCAGILEACWAVGLKFTDGFRRPIPSVFVALSIVGSMVLLASAARSLPIGTAYAVWTGIGVLGASMAGIFLFHEAVTPFRLLFLALLIASLIGLKLTEGAVRVLKFRALKKLEKYLAEAQPAGASIEGQAASQPRWQAVTESSLDR